MLGVAASLCLALHPPQAAGQSVSTPTSGDTAGYWQQRVHYEITATLDERAQLIRGRGTAWYINNSPDTLRELYFHQYLNAFRPASAWSAVDEREGRERFQNLRDPDHAFERLTAPLTVNGIGVTVDYPGAPDSTVFHLTLPTPLRPRDSVVVAFEWEARPSTLPRRQARRGRQWDLPQWYPKVAVYDRGGWQHNALQPAGEFYGEFGTYDVTLLVASDQIVAATGVPVSGDPGWSRATRSGFSRTASRAYGDVPARAVTPPPGFKAVRFYARDVHHFAWTASPDYRYEGGAIARRVRNAPTPVWDTISVHVLYRPGDDSTWGGQRVLRRTVAALQWLEGFFGPYPYPQLTVQHRIDGGGSELPMMTMNGSPSQGLILHEGGHMYAYGALANNEWRDAWFDEGLTSYQTAWAQLLTPLERVRAGITDQPSRAPGYRGLGVQMALPRFEIVSVNMTDLDLRGLAQPIGTVAHDFRDFDTYNDMVYDRSEVAFSQLRDALGDSLFIALMHDLYGHWALKHVDERAVRASATRVSGRSLDWFFDQYVHRTGVMDYRLGRVRRTQNAGVTWTTRATVTRRGEYRHPMTLGVRTNSGWTLTRMTQPPYDREELSVTTTDEPLEVRLDPYHTSWDWDRRNDVRRARARLAIDWPLLDQADRDRSILAIRPMAWYSRAGHANAGVRLRQSYLGWIDQTEFGAVGALGLTPDSTLGGSLQTVQLWLRRENPYLPFTRRPAVGVRAGVGRLDDVLKAEVGRRFDRSGLHVDGSLNYTLTQGQELLPEAWIGNAGAWTIDVDLRAKRQWGRTDATHAFLQARGVAGLCDGCTYDKVEVALGAVAVPSPASRLSVRLFGGHTGATDGVPGHRALYVSAEDPTTTFWTHWWRPRDAILKQRDVSWLPLGGPALRGYHWSVTSPELVGANAEVATRIAHVDGSSATFDIWASLFADAGYEAKRSLVDAGPGVRMQGRLYDRPITLRLDFPIYVGRPALAIDGTAERFAPRWVVSFSDIW